VRVVFPASAAEASNCSGEPYSEILSLVKLPAQVRHSLSDRPSLGAIAERGARFMFTDVAPPGEGNLPFRRFHLAAANSRCVFVAIEHGGRGYSVEIWAFEQAGEGWRGEQRASLSKVPKSIQELVSRAEK
jgi:hypothetical protein